MSRKTYWEDAFKILDEFQLLVLKSELKQFKQLTEAWKIISKDLENEIEKLSKLTEISRFKLYRLDVYKNFLKQSKLQIAKFNLEGVSIVESGQYTSGKYGIEMIQEVLNLVNTNFNHLPIDAVNNFIGLSQSGGKLYTLFEKSYPEQITKLTNSLLAGIAKGNSPVRLARDMRNIANIPLSRSLTIARTESLNLFRETSRQQMVKSKIVKGWEWIAESDACEFCLSKNGKIFPLTTKLISHPNCRCGELPVL